MKQEVGVIGLGKMGSNLVDNLLGQDYRVAGYDVEETAVEALPPEAVAVHSLEELADSLEPPRLVWMSVPAGEAVDETLEDLLPSLQEDDVVVDAGNSDYRRTRERSRWVAEEDVHLLDAGCSGGPTGAKEGLAIMVGGDREAFESVEPLFDDLSAPDGYAYFGPSGAGHYVKMVHNGVEYAFMQALGEGFELLAEGAYDDIDLEEVAGVWSNGSVVESRLVRLTRNALQRNPGLEGVKGTVPDSGMGRWTVESAVTHDVPATSVAHSLFARYRSRAGEEGTFADKLISVLRHEFGGHDVETEE